MSLFRSENPILGPLTQIVWNDGSVHYLAGDSQVQFSGSALANQHLIDAEPVLSHAGNVTVTGSVAAIRGNTTVAAGTTIIGSSYLYGTQGKLTVKGAIANTGGNGIIDCGILGQLDLSATTALSSPVAAGWFDCGGSASSAAQSGSANIDGVVIYNTTAATINSMIRSICKATYFLDLSSNSGSPMLAAKTAGAAGAKTLVVNIDGTPWYIPMSSSAT